MSVNIRTTPEKFGLTTVGEIAFRNHYEFDITAVFRAAGRLAWVSDSGCSCPTPFEDKGLDDLTFGTPAELQQHLQAQARAFDEDHDEDDGPNPSGAFAAPIADLMVRVVMDGAP